MMAKHHDMRVRVQFLVRTSLYFAHRHQDRTFNAGKLYLKRLTNVYQNRGFRLLFQPRVLVD